MSPRFLLAGNGPYANRGCEAIVRGSVEIITKRFPNASFVLSSFGASVKEEAKKETDSHIEHRPPEISPPRFLSRRWWQSVFGGLNNLTEEDQFAVQVAAMKECDCALLLGGDNYSLDYGRPTKFVAMNEALLKTGKPVIMWGASVGPFTKDPEYESIMASHLRRLTLILAREQETVAYLAKIGVTENVKLVADPAFCLSSKPPSVADKLAKVLGHESIGLNLSPLIGLYWPGGERDWFQIAMECARSLKNLSYGPLVLVPHVTIDTPYDNDYSFLASINNELKDVRNDIILLPPHLSASEYKWVISRLAVFVGARMHATIAAMSSCVPTVSIGYSLKYKGLNRLVFDSEDWLISLDHLRPETLTEKVSSAIKQSEHIRSHLHNAIPRIVAVAESAADHLADVINSRIQTNYEC